MSKNVKLKICGLRHKNNIFDVVEAGVDFIGMIFYEKSSRYVVDALYPEDVWFLPDEVEKIGVFVNASFDEIKRYAKLYQLDFIQLHGSESPELCKQLQDAGYGVVKAFGVDNTFDFESLKPFKEVADYFLFDTKTPDHGGSGITFDWSILSNYTLDIPAFVGGGVSLENLNDLLSYDYPFLHAVDMNSKLEIHPGLKDIEKVQKAVELIKG
ncbi:MAG TPA: phosphoribosylanthranilate isomerase [Chitinophagales bacterium]|nr:phosphoribosylanthranilate isomerase [Chitinophagales bacterium]